MSSEWLIGNSADANLTVSHDHGDGKPRSTDLRKADDGTRFAVCDCGAQFVIDREHGDRATIRQ